MDAQSAAKQDIQRLVKSIEQRPKEWQAYVDLVTVLTVTENFVEAEELGLKSLGLFEADVAAKTALFYALGNVYYAAGQYAQANTYFNQVDDRRLLHDATMMQAQSWYAQKNYGQALAFAVTAVEQDDKDIEARVLLGNIWLALQDLVRAKEQFDAGIALDSNNYEANVGRSIIAMAEDEINPWATVAKAINPARFQSDSQRLDEIVTLLSGSQADGQ
jgi:tetratricopeptide (TPR) repeat protein